MRGGEVQHIISTVDIYVYLDLNLKLNKIQTYFTKFIPIPYFGLKQYGFPLFLVCSPLIIPNKNKQKKNNCFEFNIFFSLLFFPSAGIT
jgi:hypothetical protein